VIPVHNAMVRSLVGLACVAPLLAGCEPETIEKREYDPFVGEAYPDKRAPVTVPAAGMGVVTDSLSDTLSLVDLGSGERFASFPVGRDPVGIDGPHHVAIDAEAGSVFVALSYPVLAGSGPHASHGSSPQSGYVQKLALDDFRVVGQVRVDHNPGDVVLSGDGRRLVVSHFDLQKAIDNPGDAEAARATLAVIDPAAVLPSGSADPRRVSVCAAPHGLALSRPDGASAYVACYGEDLIAVVDLETMTVSQRVPVGASPGPVGAPAYGPYSAVLSPDGSTLAIGNTVSGDVRFFDVATGTIDESRTLYTLAAPYFPGWTPDGARLYVPVQAPDALIVVDVAAGNAEIARRDFVGDECRAPHVAVVDSGAVLVVCEGDRVAPGKVLRVDPTSLATLSTADVGVYPDAIVRVGGTAP
jgi:YVTN family beta-propeller protein